MTYNYTKIFDPDEVCKTESNNTNEEDNSIAQYGDIRDGSVYCYTDDIILSVNIAIATGRPLLVKGKSGCGKSSLAFNVAKVLNVPFYEFVTNSRSEAKELLWSFDPVRRLSDLTKRDRNPESSKSNILTYYPYIEPGPLWWIINPDSARVLNFIKKDLAYAGYEDKIPSAAWEPESKKKNANISGVLLIDEIDKAQPDFPNNLLVPLGSYTFFIDELGARKKVELKNQYSSKTDHPLVIITTNGERELPETFIRRCVHLDISTPGEERLIKIASAILGDRHTDLYKTLYKLLEISKIETMISTAEFLDAIKASLALGIRKSDQLEEMLKKIIWKEDEKN